MENLDNGQLPERGLEHWENEVEYFETAKEAMRVCFGIISDLQEYAKKQVEELTPDREEVLK